MDVRLPDGTVIRNVPEGTTRAQLVEKLRANGYDVSQFETPSAKPRKASLAAHLNYASALALNAPLANIWLLESEDNIVWPGNLSSGDATVTAGKTANLGPVLLTLLGDSTSNGEWQRKRSPIFNIHGRYVMPVVNNIHASINMDGTDIGFLELQLYYDQVQ